MKHDDFWVEHGARNITPDGKRDPERSDVRGLLAELARGKVIDIGCGYGRLCDAFAPKDYLGVDINRELLAKARELHPGYRFMPSKRWQADTAVLYTVLLHINDDDLADFVSRIDASRVIVAEIMGRHWRREGNPPVYNREPDDYVQAFSGWALTETRRLPYRHYPDTDITFLVFDRC